MKCIVITGATGFIGRHCLPLLVQKGYEIHALSRKSPPESENSLIHWHQIDLFDQIRLKALMAELVPSHLLHLAWYVEAGKYSDSSENYKWVQASLDLILAFIECGGQRVALAGSCAEYDWQYSYCKEGVTPLNPDTVYGTAKNSLQQLFQCLIEQKNISGVWGRIFHVYGPHEHPARLVPAVIRSLLMEKPAECSHGNQIRDYSFVKDIADAFVAVLESYVTGSVNIASGEHCTLKKIIFKIAEKINRPELIRLGALGTSGKDPATLTCDTNRLFNEVGWRPKYSLDRGLEETILWWRNHMKGQLQI